MAIVRFQCAAAGMLECKIKSHIGTAVKLGGDRALFARAYKLKRKRFIPSRQASEQKCKV